MTQQTTATTVVTATRIAPVRRQVVVPVAPAVAFDVFTSEIGLWWPLGDGHSVHGEGGDVKFVDGQLVERAAGGVAVWGSVVEWAPPGLLRMTWHPGRPADNRTDISVRFAAVGDGSQTLVTLEHSGWERIEDPRGHRDDYARGWIGVLGEYVRQTAATARSSTTAATTTADAATTTGDGDQIVWLVLWHTPGVDAPTDGNVFARPEFGGHMAFVADLRDRGVLVGAGSIAGRTGHGMTIVRVPVAEVGDYVRRAQEDDRSVTHGLLQVDVRPWAVRLTG